MPKTETLSDERISEIARQAAYEAYDACSEPPPSWHGDMLPDYLMAHATADEWAIYERTFREEWHRLASACR